MKSACSILVLCLGVSLTRAADNWPEFRGPAANGQAEGSDPPVTWSESTNIRWKTPIHDKGWSSPVIWGEQIWLTTARADGKELFAVCLERGSGKVVQDIKVFTLEKPPFCHPFNSYASSTPVIEAGRIYVHFGSNGTACLDTASGKVLWTRQDLPCDHFRGAGSSPIVHDGLLFLIFDGYDQQYVAALDKQTGKTVWKTDRNIQYKTDNNDLKKAYATPVVIQADGKAQLICPSAEATIAYDPATGKELWRVIHGGMNAGSRPLFVHGLLYLTSGHTAEALAVRPGGSGDITKTNVQWTGKRGTAPTRPSLLMIDDTLYMVSDNGIALCLDAKTGEKIWQERLGGEFSSSPIFAHGRIYMPDQTGTTHVIEASRKFKSLAANKLADGCMASPAALGKCLFLRTKTHLYCLEQQ